MAAAIEENLHARAEAADARLRLAESREFAEIVQARIEEERAAIARELHDETSQSVTAIRSLALSLARRETSDVGAVREAAQLIADTAAKLHSAMHGLIPRLRPLALDALDLREALAERVAEWRRLHPEIVFTLAVGSLPEGLGESYALAIYRIVQEAVTNALRHADAQRIGIRLESDAQALSLELTDDGRGLAEDWQRAGRFGVRGMRERARALGGEIEIGNRDDGGTRVFARLPLT
jgi:two-component system sensor histidine kinase UhpB